MGLIHAEIELINGIDTDAALHHKIGEDEIRKISVTALVDTGSLHMCINENIQEVLQLTVVGKRNFRLADDKPILCDIVGPLIIKFKNRDACCRALVLPGNAEPLLGAIPLEEMDVLIHPQRQELIVNPAHPDGAVLKLVSIREVGTERDWRI